MNMQEVIGAIHNSNRVVIMTHENPDVDALASSIVVGNAIETLEKSVLFLTSSQIGKEFDFLPGIGWLKDKNKAFVANDKEARSGADEIADLQPEILVVLDASSIDQLGNVCKRYADTFTQARIINIDHHKTNTNFGIINPVDPKGSSTCELVLDLLRQMNGNIEPWMAETLLAGIIVDTGRFSTANVSSNTLRNAAFLIDRGANLAKMLYDVSEVISGKAEFWPSILSRMDQEQGGRIVSVNVPAALLEELGGNENDLRGLANHMRNMKGVRVAILFIQRSNGETKVSLRGKPGVDVGSIAMKFGGGGHIEAGSFVIRGKSLEQIRSDTLAEITGLISR